jgi:hypothetical protein
MIKEKMDSMQEEFGLFGSPKLFIFPKKIMLDEIIEHLINGATKDFLFPRKSIIL